MLPVETTPRELGYKLLLAVHLVEAGVERCYIGSKKEIWQLMKVFKNYGYLDKGYHEGFSVTNIYEVVKDNGGKIFSLDEEGGVDFPSNATIKRRYSKELFEYADKVYMWGKEQYSFISSLGFPNSLTKMLVTGHPRFQLLKPPFVAVYSKQVKNIRNRFGDFYLFVSNTKYYNHINGEDFLYTNYNKRMGNVRERIAYDKNKFRWNVRLIKQLSQRTSRNIIIRPHPEENKSRYAKIFDGYNNVFCVYDNDVVPWLLSCVRMVHNHCTTAIEYAITGGVPIAFNVNLVEGLVPKQPLEVSICFSQINSLIDYLINEGPSNIDLKPENLEAKLSYRFTLNKESFRVISHDIYSELISRENDDHKVLTTIHTIIKYNIFILKAYLKYHINELFNINTSLAKNKIGNISNKREVYRTHALFCSVLGVENININKVGGYTYLIK